MSILSFETPKKIMSKEKWTSISADGAPPGVYTPNSVFSLTDHINGGIV